MPYSTIMYTDASVCTCVSFARCSTLDDFARACPTTMKFSAENYGISRDSDFFLPLQQTNTTTATQSFSGSMFNMTLSLLSKNDGGFHVSIRASAQQDRLTRLVRKLETRLGSVWNTRRFIEVVSLHVK